MPIRPATKLFYSVAGRTVLINTYDDWSTTAVSRLLAGWFLTALPSQTQVSHAISVSVRCGVAPPQVPVDLPHFEITNGGTCYTNNETYWVTFDRSLIVFGGGRDSEVNLWVDQPYDIASYKVAQLLSHALSPALRRCNIFEIHSAGVTVPGGKDAIMITGPSGCGKSTLTAQLASRGWGYLSDDILLLHETGQEIEARAFRRFFALTADTMMAVNLPQSMPEKTGGLKERVTPQEHFDKDPIQCAVPRAIIFPSLTGELRSRTNSLTAAESMRRLLRLCPWASYDKPTSAVHLRVLGTLANTTTAFELFAGRDILDDSKIAAEVVYGVAEKHAVTR